MKTIKIEKEAIENASKPSGFDTTLDMLDICLENGGTEGVNLGQLKSRLKLSEVLENAKDEEEVSIEDADAKVLLDCVTRMQWVKFTKAVAKFAIAIEEQLK